MLYWLFQSLSEVNSGFNVFAYITLRSILGALTALLLSLLLGPWFIRRLVKQQIGQPIDAETQTLLLVRLWQGLWAGEPFDEAVAQGMESAGLEFSGKIAFADTELYTGVHHEVVESSRALSCEDCHAREAVRCARCHEARTIKDLAELGEARDPEHAPRLDFARLGYEGDPARLGGRRHDDLGIGRPAR